MICGIRYCNASCSDTYRRLCDNHSGLYWKWFDGWGQPVVLANMSLYSIPGEYASMYAVALWAEIYEYLTPNKQ